MFRLLHVPIVVFHHAAKCPRDLLGSRHHYSNSLTSGFSLSRLQTRLGDGGSRRGDPFGTEDPSTAKVFRLEALIKEKAGAKSASHLLDFRNLSNPSDHGFESADLGELELAV